MHRILTFILVMWGAFLFGQSSAFILVDISGSVPNATDFRSSTKNIVRDLCKATFNPSGYPEWKWYAVSDTDLETIIQGKGKPLVDPNKDGFLLIIPFGDKDSYKNFRMVRLNDFSEFDGHFDAFYPSVFRDQNTYIDIARARAASIAKSKKLSSYYLIEVSDQDEDTNRNASYDNQEKQLIAEYGSSQTAETKLGTYWYGNNQFRIEVKRVNLSNVQITPIAPDTANVIKSLSFIRPKGGTSVNPVVHLGPIAWQCDGCPEGTEFTVTARYTGNKEGVRPLSKKVKGSYQTSLSFSESGTYQLTVSGAGLVAKSSFASIKVSKPINGGGCGAFPLLLFLGLAAGGYFLWRRNQKPVKREFRVKDKRERDFSGSKSQPDSGDGKDGGFSDMETF